MKEIWKDVIGYEGLYQVSNLGMVKNYKTNKILKNVKTIYGYLVVTLHNNRKQKVFKVHRLVARAFYEICGTWFEGCQIDHIDGDKTNNKATNLRVCTSKENINNPNTLWKIQGENHHMYGKTHTEEARNKMSNANKGKKRSEESINKQRRTFIGKYCGENHPMYGKHHNEETKRKISESNKGKKHSEYTKLLMSKNSPKKRNVIQYTLEMVEVCRYSSLTEAANNTGSLTSHISNCCRGKLKYHNGFVWRYDNE